MTKHASGSNKEGALIRPYEPFHNSPVPIGTRCTITNEQEDTYTVKFPGRVGYSGSFSIKRVYVQLDD